MGPDHYHSVGKDSGVDPPDGFEALKVGDKINAEITGKVTGITQADGSSSIDIEMDEVELESAAEEAKEEKKNLRKGKQSVKRWKRSARKRHKPLRGHGDEFG